jgi:ferredoxin
VLDAEIELIERFGMRFTPNWTLGKSGTLDELRASHDAVLLACGATVNWTDKEHRGVDLDWVRAMGFKTNKRGLVAGRRDYTTGIDGVFAAGELTTGASNMVYAVAAGRGASVAIGQYLSAQALAGAPLPFYFWRRQLTDHEEVVRFGRKRVERNPDIPGGLSAVQAAAESYRCLECQCAKEHTCRLRSLGAEYSPSPYRFRGERRELDTDHSHGELVYEPGKCILCGNCIEVARLAGEEEGLSFVGRGLSTKVVVPLCSTLSDGIRRSAHEIVEGCPTAAFSLRNAPPSALK